MKEGTIARKFREHYEGKTATRNSKVLADFTAYCRAHPEERFWQALRNWAGFPFIHASKYNVVEGTTILHDTFYWEGRNG